MRFVFITMDGNHAGALREAERMLQRDQQVEISLGLYDATTLREADDWARLHADLARADFVFGSMLFGEELVRPLERALDAVICSRCIITSNPSLIYKTRLGKFTLKPHNEADDNPLMQWARKLRPKKDNKHGEGRRQLAMMRNIGKLLQHIPGKARDLHTYIVAHQYWLHASPENLRRMLCLLIDRYVAGYAGKLVVQEPLIYPMLRCSTPMRPRRSRAWPRISSGAPGMTRRQGDKASTSELKPRQGDKETRRQGDKETRRQNTFSLPISQSPQSPNLPISQSPNLPISRSPNLPITRHGWPAVAAHGGA